MYATYQLCDQLPNLYFRLLLCGLPCRKVGRIKCVNVCEHLEGSEVPEK